jgi:hypothetical protein
MVMQKRQILVIFLIILYITLITKLERLLVHCAARLTPILSFTLLFNHQITSETSICKQSLSVARSGEWYEANSLRIQFRPIQQIES